MYAPEDAEPIRKWAEGKFEAFLEEYKGKYIVRVCN